jgi:quercetin dioxygenase-like cupin family protein
MKNKSVLTFSYPHTIDNGHGESITFLSKIIENGFEYLAVVNEVQPGGGPPMHTHHQQDEALTIVEGRLGMQVAGQDPVYLGPGGYAHFKAGVSHRFWNAGDTILKCRGRIWPAGNIEYFLGEIFRSTAASRNARPSAFDAAFLLHRYASEFSMDGIPSIVRRFVFPVVLIAGRIGGLDKKFVNAPEALSMKRNVQTDPDLSGI